MAPPVMEARRWMAAAPADRPLLNLSQAAPVAPPPEGLRQAMAAALTDDPTAHLYGPVLGRPELRAALADRWSAAYGGQVTADQVAITAGCNQAFCAALATLAGPGDAVILPTPWYFNHKMWLDMAGVETIPLPTDQGLIPDPAVAAETITPATRAIVLVTPNNPAGVAYPAEVVGAFADLARARGLTLILDETYRDFAPGDGPPHGLFTEAWEDHVVALYSFSKAYRLTGHRVGAMIAAPWRLAQVEKFLDTVAVCTPQVGQSGALWGLRHLDDWLAGERREVLARGEAMRAEAARLPGWGLLGCGAYFAYLRHPWDVPSDRVAKWLVEAAGILVLPGTMFAPPGDAPARRTLRVAFANADAAGLAEMRRRLTALPHP